MVWHGIVWPGHLEACKTAVRIEQINTGCCVFSAIVLLHGKLCSVLS